MEENNEERIIIAGWKGKSELDIWEAKQYFRLKEYRKNKETGELYSQETKIDSQDVYFLLGLIKQTMQQGIKYDYKYIIKKLISIKKIHEKENVSLEIMIEMFNGGKFRAKYYFPLYYYPLKVIEAKGYIDYFGDGGIMLK